MVHFQFLTEIPRNPIFVDISGNHYFLVALTFGYLYDKVISIIIQGLFDLFRDKSDISYFYLHILT